MREELLGGGFHLERSRVRTAGQRTLRKLPLSMHWCPTARRKRNIHSNIFHWCTTKTVSMLDGNSDFPISNTHITLELGLRQYKYSKILCLKWTIININVALFRRKPKMYSDN